MPICSDHRLDDLGWPLGNCDGCRAYRKLMSDWHFDCALSGEPRPELVQAQTETEEGL